MDMRIVVLRWSVIRGRIALEDFSVGIPRGCIEKSGQATPFSDRM